MTARLPGLFGALAAVCLGAAGCRTTTGAPEASVAAYELLAATPPSAAWTMDDYALGANRVRYRLWTANDLDCGVREHRRETTDQYGAQWVVHLGDDRSEFRRLDEQGRTTLTASIDRSDRALTFFDPPLVLFPARLGPGEERQQTVKMRVVELNRPTSRKAAGSATRSVRYTGDQRLRVDGREFSTARLDISFHADLSIADVEVSTTQFLSPEHGLLIEHRVETIKVLGFTTGTTDQTLILVHEPGVDHADEAD